MSPSASEASAADGPAGLAAAPGPVPPSSLEDDLRQRYPDLPLPPEAAQDLPLHPLRLPAGVTLFEEKSPCAGFPLVLSGDIRVARGTPGGRSIELYRVGPGELCVVSTASLFGGAPMPAHGVTSEPTELLVVPPATFERWTEHLPFRRHVFALFAARLTDLIGLTEAVAFQRLDQRLAGALLGHGAVIHATHQQLAEELGTVREIVTRLLRRLERDGLVSLARERIEIRDPAALRRLAAGQT